MLEAIRFKDCQSLSDCILPFTKRLNVIVAANNTGKSVLYKVLKLAGRADYYTREERKDLIRRGAAEAQITFKFDDGAYALMKVMPSKTAYAFLENDKSKIAWYLEPPSEMINHLGLLVSNTEAFIANIVDMDQGLLLVNPRLQSNYELIKMITTCEFLDELREKVDSLLAEFKEKSMRTADSVNFVERQLAQLEYYDVESMEKKYRIAEMAKDWLFNCCTIFEGTALVERVTAKCRDFEGLLKAVSVMECMGMLLYLLPKCGVGKKYFWESELEALLSAENLLGSVKRVTLRRPLPVCCETMLTVEELLAEIKLLLDKVQVWEYSDKDSLFNVLELLERTAGYFSAVSVGKEPASVLLADALFWAESLLRAVKSFSVAVAAARMDKANAAVWETKFIESGESIRCPIWGEVIFDGKSCLVKEVSGG